MTTWVVIASGPSLTKSDVEHCRNRAKVCVVNNCHEVAPWADILYAADRDWWDIHNPLDFGGEKWTICPDSAKKHKLNMIDSQNGEGICTKEGMIHYGGNSGFQACNLVYHRKPKRILLLGFDMQDTGGKRHWFGDHKWPLRNTNVWATHVKRMDAAAPFYKAGGVEVINCTRETALKAYRREIITDCL